MEADVDVVDVDLDVPTAAGAVPVGLLEPLHAPQRPGADLGQLAPINAPGSAGLQHQRRGV
jgi:hypothetical protein